MTTGNLQTEYEVYYIGQKNSNKRRLIQQPSEELKKIQKDLIPLYEMFTLHKAATCKKGSSPLDAALPHLGAKYLLKVDLSNCYQHITYEKTLKRIKRDYPDNSFKEEMIRNLPYCFIEWNGTRMLPTGAPTSPILCNIVLSAVDYYVQKTADRFGYAYTRYMDDLNLSTKSEKRDWKLINLVKGMVIGAGYPINKKKTKWYGRGNNDAKIVAGVSLESISRRQVKRLIRARLQNLALNKEPIDSITRGYLAYIKSIDFKTYSNLNDYYQKRLEYVPLLRSSDSEQVLPSS
jgi:RNA-directed DNA polymerase